MGPEFHQTGLGRQFYEITMPAIAKSLAEVVVELRALTEMVKDGVESDKEIRQSKEPTTW